MEQVQLPLVRVLSFLSFLGWSELVDFPSALQFTRRMDSMIQGKPGPKRPAVKQLVGPLNLHTTYPITVCNLRHLDDGAIIVLLTLTLRLTISLAMHGLEGLSHMFAVKPRPTRVKIALRHAHLRAPLLPSCHRGTLGSVCTATSNPSYHEADMQMCGAH